MELEKTNFYRVECEDSTSLRIGLLGLSLAGVDILVERYYKTEQSPSENGFISSKAVTMVVIKMPTYQLEQVPQFREILGLV